ncbi:alanine--tRNA ligase [Candidatus Woesearchaeota archaeon]|nr:alanine--tRNA ligase [Candidatus Woesearchaeota archaeon]
MLTDKQLKKKYEVEFRRNPEKYYPAKAMQELGFTRGQCSCGRFFWSPAKQAVCGDPSCSGGFRFIGDTPAKRKLDYVGVWKSFSSILQKRGYTPIPRYPVVARWRSDIEFVEASIDDFIPYVINGEVQPPANPLTVPQFCLRFNDVDNVGITGAHYTGFVMMGQHRFHPPAEYRPDDYLLDLYSWLSEGMGLDKSELTLHEDVWAGSGNFGPCVEFFSRGLEIANQVYMQFRQTESGYEDLRLKVLDMGQGQERAAWFCQGKSTSFETTFPTVTEKLYRRTGISPEPELIARFLPYASYLNVDEVSDIEKAWKGVAEKVGVPVRELRETILPLAAIYSIAEHSRSLLIALSDSGLPSNVGGGYNLRAILRRALSFIQQYKWDIDLAEVCAWHAQYLKPMYPELAPRLDQVRAILEVEKERFAATREKSRAMVQRLVQSDVREEKLLELYDSHGISPEMVRDAARELGRDVAVPDNFYAKVAALHEEREQAHATHKEREMYLTEVPESEALYFEDYAKTSFVGKVASAAGPQVVLEKTYFYPTSGGQVNDTGSMEGIRVVDVFKHGNAVVHQLERDAPFARGASVRCEIDRERRVQLAKHHTATHILNAAARRVLGAHVNQAGAKKAPDKAHLDLTHYQNLSPEEVAAIEQEANAIVRAAIPVESSFLGRDVAEKRFGMGIYQGGAVPGKRLRIVNIVDTDVEACGGTHLKNTSEAGTIRIIKSKKIQDGIVRLYFTAGAAAQRTEGEQEGLLEQTAALLGVAPDQCPARCEELFTTWKRIRKALKKTPPPDAKEFELVSPTRYVGDALQRCAEIFSTQPEHVPKTAKRFLDELRRFREELAAR